MELIEARRRILMLPQSIRVTWNQYGPALNADNYEPTNTNNIDVTYANGEATITWKKNVNTYRCTLRSRYITPVLGDKWYCSILHNPSKTGTYRLMIPNASAYFADTSCAANTWTRVSGISETAMAAQTRIGYFPYLASSASGMTGQTCTMKAFILINLTQMYGAGNEPDLETFEKQCAKNGVDLTAFQEENPNGTQRWWYV